MSDRPPGITRRGALARIGAGLGAVAGGALLPACGLDGAARSCANPDGGAARGLLSSVDALVVVMMENRSFDHLLGALRTDPSYPSAGRIDGLRGDESNPDSEGRPVRVTRRSELTLSDPPHTWDPCRVQLDGGRADGFVRAHAGPDQADAMAFYDRATLPVYYSLADHFTVCDRWFSSVLGPTWPNRFYLHAATSAGRRGNEPFLLGGPPTVWEGMATACRTFKNYAAGAFGWYPGAFAGKALSGGDPLVMSKIQEFFRDARDGTLPNYSLIDPDFHVADDHPPSSIALGQGFVGAIYRALADGPKWRSTLLVVIYDEHGGFFDHVPPPLTVDPDADFQQLGFRVPALVVGPMVRRGYVDSTPLEHVSIAATLKTRFGIASLGPRMDAARDLSSCIDPAAIDAPAPPRSPWLPRVRVSRRAIAARLAHPSSQPELDRMAAAGRIAPHAIDDRRSPLDRVDEWLRIAEELGAVEVSA